jgi:lipoyl(octanoyl) transferase
VVPQPAGVRIRPFARAEYASTLEAMRAFTAGRDEGTGDEIWLVEHPPVFTLGLAARTSHLHGTGDIPVVRTERGGQVTYHGPGQVVAYLMLDLRRRGIGIRELVNAIEQAVIDCLAAHGVDAVRKPGAPGVYVRAADGSPGAKIASLGIKVTRGCTFHGVALNVDMDLEPFGRIDPCGYPGQEVTDLRSLGVATDVPAVAEEFAQALVRCIGTGTRQ